MADVVDADVWLARQPILDRAQNLVAYELLFRRGLTEGVSVTDGRLATATVIRNIFSELSIGNVLGSYRGYINVDEGMLFSDVPELLPSDVVVLEILETVEPTAPVVERCAELVAQGYTLALDDVVQLGEEYLPLLPHVSVVKVDIGNIESGALPRVGGLARQLGKRLLAEKVESCEDMQHCHRLGFHYFQGYYFARPVVIKGRKLSPSQMALVRLLNLIAAEASVGQLETVLKQEPGLALNLLKIANSAAVALPHPVSSLRHAVMLLGLAQLRRWVQLLLYTGGAGQASSPLLQLAATRGCLMELLAERMAPGDRRLADAAFMTGILSLTPALFSQPIEDIVSALALEHEVRVALCSGEGVVGSMLAMCQALESNDTDAIAKALTRLPEIPLSHLGRMLAQALTWANGVDRAA